MAKHGKRRHVHRRLHVGDHGPDVRELQQGLGAFFKHWKIPGHTPKVDERYGRHTKGAALLALLVAGFSRRAIRKNANHGLGPRAQRIIRRTRRRSPAMRLRTRRRRRRIRRLRDRGGPAGSLGAVNVNLAPGAPHWGGGQDIIDDYVAPFLARYGIPEGSGKRTPAYNAAIGGSPNSDHLTTHTTTAAEDFPTYSGEEAARALARTMGYEHWAANSYGSSNVRVDGTNFRVQILWGSGIGHGDHIHVGIGR